jgi:hypothetical protein
MILVHAGLPGGLNKIQNEITKADAKFDKPHKIIITH